jgi:hypothetical protein
MEEAAKKGDVEGYLENRRIAEEAKKQAPLFSPERREPLPDIYELERLKSATSKKAAIEPKERLDDSSYNDYEAGKRKRRGDRMKEDRAAFLASTKAVPTPMEAYALWLAVYESQGGKVSRETYDSNFTSKSRVFGADNTIQGAGGDIRDGKVPDYESLAWNRWSPTRPGAAIPAGYGSTALEVFLLPDVVPQSVVKATNDHRQGWEWGHTKVYALVKDSSTPTGLRAWTNESRAVSDYEDTRAYRRSRSIEDMMRDLGGTRGFNALDK